MNFLTSRPGWVLILLLFIFTALAMTGPFLVRLRIRLAHLRGNNEVAGFKFAVIGVLYAVLLAFVVIISWERFYDAEKALAREAGASATIYRPAYSRGSSSRQFSWSSLSIDRTRAPSWSQRRRFGRCWKTSAPLRRLTVLGSTADTAA